MARFSKAKPNIKRALATFLSLLFVVLMGADVYAGTMVMPPYTAYLTVEQQFHNQKGSPMLYATRVHYILECVNPGDPMPSGSTGNQYRFYLSAYDITTIGPILFQRPGKYEYTLKPVEPPNPEKYTWDGISYSVEVFVRNDNTYTLVVNNGQGTKGGALVFRYQGYEKDDDRPTEPERTLNNGGGGGGIGAGNENLSYDPNDPTDPNHPDYHEDEPVDAQGMHAGNTSGVSNGPDTGDNGNIFTGIVIAAVSLFGLLACIALEIYERKRKA